MPHPEGETPLWSGGAPESSVVIPIGPPPLSTQHVAAALASVARQTDRRFEALLVADRCASPVAEVLWHFARTDPRFRVLPSKAPGLVNALQTGLHVARGRWLVRMDADDLMAKERLAAQRKALSNVHRPTLLGTAVRPLDAAPGMRRYCVWQNGLLTHDALAAHRFVDCVIAHPSWAAPCALFRRLGGWRDRGWPEDMDLICRALEHGVRLAKLPEPLLIWRDRSDRTSRTDRRYAAHAFLRLRVHYLRRALPALAGARALWIWGAGRGGARLGRSLSEAGIPVHGYIDVDPRRIGSTRHGRPVVDGKQLPPSITPERVFVLSALGGAPRDRIAKALMRRGFVLGNDFLPCA